MNPMFNPEMMNQMKHMINPQMMKQAADSFATMSDDQIRAYLAQSGMGHISPQMFRQMSGNMKNMDDSELEKIKNSNNFNKGTQNQFGSNTPTPIPTPTPSTNSSSLPNPGYNLDPPKQKTIIEKLDEIKNKGNDIFRQGKYKEACEKYYEALNELEYIPDTEKINLKKQIEDLEIVCRLNIANSKLKMEDYDLVIHECLKVLKMTENFKAHYRAGVSFYKKRNYNKASHHFTKAKEVNKNEEALQIEKYLKECEEFIKDSEKDKAEENINKINKIETNTTPINTLSGAHSKIDKLKEIVKNDTNPDYSTITNKNNKDSTNIQKNKKDEDEIIIEEVKQTSKKRDLIKEDNFSSIPSNTSNISYNGEIINNAEKELSKMDDNQLNGMINMVKTMDNATLKSMMSMQGMNLSDDQIAMMKNNLSPEMMKMMKNNSGGMTSRTPNSFNATPSTNTNLSNNITESLTQENNSQPSLPNFNNFKGFPDMKNMDMGSMMKMVQDNPQIMNMMGPQMSQMFGGGQGGEAQGGMNNDMMMKTMQNIFWLMSLPSRIKAFITSTRGMLIISLVLILIIAYFYR